MDEPWLKYQQAAAPTDGPWTKYAPGASGSPVNAENLVRAAGTGIPVVGGLLNKMDAATNAALAPMVDPLLPDSYQKLPEGSFGERYQHALDIQNRKDTDFEKAHPIVDTAAQIAGGVAATLPAASTALGGRLLGLTGGSLPARAITSAATNATLGGADAALRGNDVGQGAVLGGVTGLAAPLVGQVAGKVAGAARNLISPSVAVPTTEDIGNAAEQGYQKLRDLGVEFNPSSIATMAQDAQQGLMKDGLRPTLAPKTFSVLSELQNPPEGAGANFADVHALRRVLGTVAGSPDATERMAASRTIGALDDFLNSPPKGAVLSGDAQSASKLLGEANANYAAKKTSEALQGKVDAADLQAASANSGANFENALRQRLRGILNSPSQRRGFSADEITAMQSIVRGTAPANVIRTIGNLLGGGGGLGSVVSGSAGFLAGGPAGAVAAPAAGYALKQIGNAMTRSKASALDELIRLRAPAAQQAALARAIAQAAARRSAMAGRTGVGVLAPSAGPVSSSFALGQNSQ